MAKFMVNKLSDDGLVGETTEVNAILYNLVIIGQEYKDGFMALLEQGLLPYAVQICVCGRFITYIELSRDLKQGSMRFYDCKNDNDIALDSAKEVQEGWYGNYYFNWFMQLFTELKEFYDGNYDAAELLPIESAGIVLN